jgi:hypothetical protein
MGILTRMGRDFWAIVQQICHDVGTIGGLLLGFWAALEGAGPAAWFGR